MSKINLMWLDFEMHHSQRHYSELLHLLLVSLVLMLSRYILENFLFKQIGLWLGLKDRQSKKAPYRPVLENVYLKSKSWDDEMIYSLAKQSDLPTKEIKVWLKLRNGQNKTTVLEKFCESMWKLTFYMSTFMGGIFILWNKSWLWDIKECWRDYYNQKITNDVWWFYMISWSYLCASFLSIYSETRRNDFYVTLVHHIVSVTLGFIGWASNPLRMCSLLFVCLYPSDIFLQMAKVAKYLGYGQLTLIVLFLIFTIMWIVTRLWIFPFKLIRSFFVDVPIIVPNYATTLLYYFGVPLLSFICILQCIWTYYVLKLLINLVINGYIKKDLRSDSED